MTTKYKRTASFMLVLVVTVTAWLLLFSSSSTQAATADASAKQLEQAEGSEQAQPIIRPELILSVSIAPEPAVGEIVTLGFAATFSNSQFEKGVDNTTFAVFSKTMKKDTD
ncbi:hypothetical protein MNBD_CHLOROFLEXI01-4558 [hydrothermal vent metagenome]|uniref:Uncharacterized protein n=1 Tax=hydrothermal vent metagenome TaxID=652676 RepID=A0A3B0WD48_9ZZZZ